MAKRTQKTPPIKLETKEPVPVCNYPVRLACPLGCPRYNECKGKLREAK